MRTHSNNTEFLSILLILCSLLFSCSREQTPNIAATVTPVTKIILSDAQIQLANIKVMEVQEDIMEKNFELTGVLRVNEESAVSISARADGRIQKLFFKGPGGLTEIFFSAFSAFFAVKIF